MKTTQNEMQKIKEEPVDETFVVAGRVFSVVLVSSTLASEIDVEARGEAGGLLTSTSPIFSEDIPFYYYFIVMIFTCSYFRNRTQILAALSFFFFRPVVLSPLFGYPFFGLTSLLSPLSSCQDSLLFLLAVSSSITF